LSPFSVYCNFRYVQLMEVRPGASMLLSAGPAAAGDFEMVYHYFIVAGLCSLALFSACVRRLQRLSTQAAQVQPGLMAALRGQFRRNHASDMFVLTTFVTVFSRFTIDAFDERPLSIITLGASIIAAPLMVGAATNAIASEREGHTPAPLDLSGVTPRQMITRA